MVSFNPNLNSGRVINRPKTAATPQPAEPQPETKPQVQSTQPKITGQPQQISVDNESMLAFKGIQINKAEKPENADEGAKLESIYNVDSIEEFKKLVNIDVLKPGDVIYVETQTGWMTYEVDMDGNIVLKPDKPSKNNGSTKLESVYFPDNKSEYNKIVYSGILKEGDSIKDPDSGLLMKVYKDEDGRLELRVMDRPLPPTNLD